MDITELLGLMTQAVAKHKQGDLTLGWRIRLWKAMKAEFGREADFRRNVLAFLVARDAYPDWQQGELVSAIPPGMIDEYYAYPGRALDEYARFLKRKSSRDKVRAVIDPLADALDYWEGQPHDRMELACIIILQASDRLLGSDDEMYEDRGWFDTIDNGEQHLQITDDSLGERVYCEPHFFAAMAATLDTKKEVAVRREFWHHWLTETVPSVLTPLPEVKALLRSWKGSGAAPVDSTAAQRHEIPAANAKEALRQHLQALALTAAEQQKLYSKEGCQICGLTMTVQTWTDHAAMAALVKKQNAKRRGKLRQIQELADEVVQDNEVHCYDYEFTRKDPRWREIRKLARELLDDCGWPCSRRAKRERFVYGLPVEEV